MIHEARRERQAQAGEADEFASLYRRHGRDVLGMLLHLTHGDRAEAEDLTQETFLAAFRGRRSFAGRASVRAWLVGIAVRRFRDARRRPPAPVGLPADLDDRSPLPSPESGVVASDCLARALARLPENQQTALLLVLGQGLTYREAADALGEPVGTIKWRVSEATGKLRAYLTEDENDALPPR
jgi:RNA polymerase sigma-70 factor (ECF subfamily)